jgi:hypothetical protein
MKKGRVQAVERSGEGMAMGVTMKREGLAGGRKERVK